MNKEYIFPDTIERHCALHDMHDDGGYCDTKIKKYDSYYVGCYGDNGEVYCTECILNLVLLMIKENEKFEYKDFWRSEIDSATHCTK